MSGTGRRTGPDPHPPTLIRMNLFHRTPPAPTSTPDTPAAQSHDPAAAPRRLARQAMRILACGILTGAATAAGKAAMDIVITLIHHH